MDEELLITTVPVKKGAVSGVLSQEITRGSDLIACAKVTWACVNHEGIPMKLPPEWENEKLKPVKAS
jgi:acyl-CoA thioester hydrolase